MWWEFTRHMFRFTHQRQSACRIVPVHFTPKMCHSTTKEFRLCQFVIFHVPNWMLHLEVKSQFKADLSSTKGKCQSMENAPHSEVRSVTILRRPGSDSWRLGRVLILNQQSSFIFLYSVYLQLDINTIDIVVMSLCPSNYSTRSPSDLAQIQRTTQ